MRSVVCSINLISQLIRISFSNPTFFFATFFRCNFSDVEIEMLMSQYDTNENEEIDENEAIKVFQDLSEGKNITGLQENLPVLKKISKLPCPNEADIEK